MILATLGSRWRVGAAMLALAVAVGGCTATRSPSPGMLSQGASDVRLASLEPVSQADRTEQPLFLTAYSGARPPQGFEGVCERYAWACSTQRGTISDDEALRIAVRINRRVNARIRAVPDHEAYGVRERWTLPERGAGDCEDFALLKKKLLIEAGLPGSLLLLATGLNRRAEPHAVLVLRLQTGDVILDNLTSAARPWQATGYTFLKIQSPDAPRIWSAVLLGPFASRA
jgi:predicted transglutaminase-like cysteine proteinase